MNFNFFATPLKFIILEWSLKSNLQVPQYHRRHESVSKGHHPNPTPIIILQVLSIKTEQRAKDAN